MDSVCTKPDQFTFDQEYGSGVATWRVELTNGEVVIQDDHRLGASPPQAWLRLRAYLARHQVGIRRMWLQFRSNEQRDILPANAEGYFFCKQCIGFVQGKKTYHSYILGALQNGKLMVHRWQVPELICAERYERDATSCGDCLILNTWRQTNEDQSQEQVGDRSTHA